MKFKNNSKNSINIKGQTLIEVSIVFGIASIVIVSLVILASSAIRQAQNATRVTTASKLANAGIEAVVYEKNFKGFGEETVFPQTNGTTACARLNSSGTGLESNLCGIGNAVTLTTINNLTYQRQISITKNTNTYTVDVIVRWQANSNTIDSVAISRQITNY